MEVLIKDVDGVLVFDTIAVITESQYNKINAGINKRSIASWCDDNGNVSVSTDKRAQNTLIFKEIVDVITSTSISDAEKLCLEFLKFVDNLPEVDVADDKVNMDDLEFVKNVASNEHIVGAILMGEIDKDLPLCVSCGKISGTLLKELFALYIEKYEPNKTN